MTQVFYEQRRAAARGTDSLAADITRHIHARQNLGSAVIICAQPIPMLSAVRKQWLRLARTVQRQRAATLNADKILKYTRSITKMQHMRFTTKSPGIYPDHDIFCVTNQLVHTIPQGCQTIYLADHLSHSMAKDLILVAPTQTLIVDYKQYSEWEKLGLLPKRSLEETLAAEWNRINAFLADQQIDSHNLHTGIMTNVTAMDIALDILLDTSHQFLELADVFQKALSHARPLRLSKPVRMQYDSVILLAHRVQALSPGEFSHRFLDSYNEDDTFFLYDNGKFASGETLRERHTRYMQHGLVRLAQALIRRYS